MKIRITASALVLLGLLAAAAPAFADGHDAKNTAAALHNYGHRKKMHAINAVDHSAAHVHNVAHHAAAHVHNKVHRGAVHTQHWLNNH